MPTNIYLAGLLKGKTLAPSLKEFVEQLEAKGCRKEDMGWHYNLLIPELEPLGVNMMALRTHYPNNSYEALNSYGTIGAGNLGRNSRTLLRLQTTTTT